MRKIIKLCLVFLLALAWLQARSQSQEQLIRDWERAKTYTRHYLDAMPEEDYAFKPAPETRTFAEHMLHLTDANFELAPLAGGLKSPIGPGAAGKDPDKSKANTTRLVMSGYDFVISNIRNLKPAELQDTITVFGKYRMTRATLFSKLFEHQTHHRGQTTIYFRLKGIKPPDEELF